MNINDAMLNDIAFTSDYVRSPGGDLQTINGIANLKQALFHRLITVPGTLVHRPTYGVGIKMFQNSLASFSNQSKLAALITEQFKQDKRVEEVTGILINPDDTTPELTIIQVTVKPVGYSELQFSFVPFGDNA